MTPLRFTSCMAGNMDFVGRAMARYVTDRLAIPTEFVEDIPWPERERRFDAGEIQVAWICGLPYVWKVDQPEPPLELLVAPVMQDRRYQDRPIYFSDVVVHRDSRFHTFADLRRASWAYNEPGSQSGYNITRYHLAKLGEFSGYFGQVIEAGAHQTSLQMILARQVEASAIDATVLELELALHPEIAGQIRVIDTLGPSPIPPWVILKQVPQTLRETLRAALLDMHRTPAGRAILAEARMDRFVRVEDHDYDPIRQMAAQAAAVTL